MKPRLCCWWRHVMRWAKWPCWPLASGHSCTTRVFYRSGLVPRWLSVWGLVAVASVMLSGILVMLRLAEPMSTIQIVLALPIFLQEMVLAVWLIAKGFDPAAIARQSVGDGTGWRATASSRSGSPA